MNHLSYSRRRFLSNSSMGLVAFSSMPGILYSMESMHGMPKLLPNKFNVIKRSYNDVSWIIRIKRNYF